MTNAIVRGAAVAAAIATASALPAAAAETWLQCEGSVATVNGAGAKPESKPVRDVYAFDDSTRRLFKYSETRRVLDPVFVTDFDRQKIKWSSPAGPDFVSARWEGAIDRAKLALSLVR